jgi:hypothetical protein
MVQFLSIIFFFLFFFNFCWFFQKFRFFFVSPCIKQMQGTKSAMLQCQWVRVYGWFEDSRRAFSGLRGLRRLFYPSNLADKSTLFLQNDGNEPTDTGSHSRRPDSRTKLWWGYLRSHTTPSPNHTFPVNVTSQHALPSSFMCFQHSRLARLM